QIALDEVQILAHVVDVLGLASPPAGSPDLRALGQRVLGEVAADEAGNARDEDTDGHLSLLAEDLDGNLPRTRTIELREDDRLESAERQFTAVDAERDVAAEQRREQMG